MSDDYESVWFWRRRELRRRVVLDMIMKLDKVLGKGFKRKNGIDNKIKK